MHIHARTHTHTHTHTFTCTIFTRITPSYACMIATSDAHTLNKPCIGAYDFCCKNTNKDLKNKALSALIDHFKAQENVG